MRPADLNYSSFSRNPISENSGMSDNFSMPRLSLGKKSSVSKIRLNMETRNETLYPPSNMLLTERNYSKIDKFQDHVEELRSENHHLMNKYNQVKKESEWLRRNMVEIQANQSENAVSIEDYQHVVDENQEFKDKIIELENQLDEERIKRYPFIWNLT